MVVATKLRQHLEAHKIPYEVLKHRRTYTSQEIAETLHVPGREMAKVVIVKADGKLVMAVLPANLHLDLPAFGRLVGAKKAALATEAEFQDRFPDCELGAMPPFGHLYDLDVWVDRALTRDERILFEAGNHEEAIAVSYDDFAKLAEPKIGDFSMP